VGQVLVEAAFPECLDAKLKINSFFCEGVPYQCGDHDIFSPAFGANEPGANVIKILRREAKPKTVFNKPASGHMACFLNV